MLLRLLVVALAVASESGEKFGRKVADGVVLLTGEVAGRAGRVLRLPELADPYVTLLGGVAVVSGTGRYYLKFRSLEAIAAGGPFEVRRNDFHYADGTPMEDGSHSWDLKPVAWSSEAPESAPRLWDRARDRKPPLVVWYGGHMRPRPGRKTSRWPEDNFSRDVFAFVERSPGKWFSLEESVFAVRRTWPRAAGNYLGHRYGHQIVMRGGVPVVFYEEVTRVRPDGSPLVTSIFMDEMASPFKARGQPIELLSPINPRTGKPFGRALRENGAALVEGPLYFRFEHEGEEWEALGFSAGSYYASYPSCFASRRVADGLRGKPYQLDLEDDGSDLNDAGEALGRSLRLTGGPGRPAVIIAADGKAIRGATGRLQALVHAYRRDAGPAAATRVVLHVELGVKRGSGGALRFKLAAPKSPRPVFAKQPPHETAPARARRTF